MVRKISLICGLVLTVFAATSAQGAISAPSSFSISESKVQDLRGIFNQGSVPTQQQLLERPRWNCTIYSMRSRQRQLVQEGFYAFTANGNTTNVKNNGAQIVKDFRSATTGFVGDRGPVKDVLRISPVGHLIAEVSIPKRNPYNSLIVPVSRNDLSSLAATDRLVVAYAKCH